MFIPIWGLAVAGVAALLFVIWAFQAAGGRNPLPFPDNGSRIFAAASPGGQAAMVALLAKHGLKQRFEVNTGEVSRSILWDGTIVNTSSPEVMRKLKGVAACIGLVANSPAKAAERAAAFLRAKGFSAEVVLDAEPDLDIAFVLTDAMVGTAINFRPHVTRMPRPK